MKTVSVILACLGLGMPFSQAADKSVAPHQNPRNLAAELLGRSKSDIDAKLKAAWDQLFYGADAEQRIYYPTGTDEAYIADVAHEDVRSEGMSYGLMIAVQQDKKQEFDRLWKWARTHMYHASGPRHGYFAWQCRYDGTHIDPGSASDGEEWIAMALFFAAHRWGNGNGIFNYNAEAQALLKAMRDGNRGEGITAIFDPAVHQVVFAPSKEASRLTDPSYHLPAFYELWARWDESPEGRTFWQQCVVESRAFLRRTAHPKTGLMAEYAHFDGRPYSETDFGKGKNDFRYDARRIMANVAIDHAWFAADPWQVEQSNRILKFFSQFQPDYPTELTLEGAPLSRHGSIGVPAMAAVAGMASEPALARPHLERLWSAPVPSGKWRYYDGLLYFLGLLQTSGNFRIYGPN